MRQDAVRQSDLRNGPRRRLDCIRVNKGVEGLLVSATLAQVSSAFEECTSTRVVSARRRDNEERCACDQERERFH